MTTKIKIIVGFVCMMLILIVLAFIGYTSLQQSSKTFTNVNRLATLNTVASDLVAGLYMLEDETYQFLDRKDLKNMDNAQKGLQTAIAKSAQASKLVVKPERVEALAKINGFVNAMSAPLNEVKAGVTESARQYAEVVRPATQTLSKDLLELSDAAAAANNSRAAYLLAESLSTLGPVGNALGRFTENRSAEEASSIVERLAALKQKLQELETVVQTEGGKRIYANILKSFDNLNKSFSTMKLSFEGVEKSLKIVQQNLGSVLAISNELNAGIDKEANATAAALLDDNSSAQAKMFGVSLGGIIFAVIIALFIIIGLVRVLTQLADYAGAIAKGNFAYNIKVREKGEIGAMVNAMKNIPTTLSDIIAKADRLADRVASGFMRDQLLTKEFVGSFANIAESVNLVGASYLQVIDSLTLPVMAADANNIIIFLNKLGQTVLDGNYTNEGCAEHLAANECGTDKCFGYCSMKHDKPYAGETTVNIKGKAMDVAVSAFPLHNLKKEVVGYAEILTDLTEIHEQQKAIMRAVEEASSISDRVASASEELSAQVEEVSRGADIERERVGSTATAMEEMNATVLEVAKNSGQASEQSDNTRRKAEEGAGLVNNVVSSINMVNKVAVTLQDNMQELGKQAEDIGGVMNVISDIADQTNLLALNAAIEAARAGEAGRGFAVVADEVRKLAEKTMQATNEVGSTISAIQRSAHMNISEVSNAVTSISEATSLANSSGVALQEIVDLAAANSSVVASIATAAEQQSATSEEINRAIEEINRIVIETTEGMEQSSIAVQELSRMAQDLRRVMESLSVNKDK